MTWKAAIAKAWTVRGRRHIIGALIVGSVCGIVKTVMDGFGPGLLTWVLLTVGMFAVYIGDDARLQRQKARKEAASVSD